MTITIRYGRFTTTAAAVVVVGGGVPLMMMMMMMIGWLPKSTFALNSDGFSLLALKAAVTHDPHQVLAGWGERDGNPCGWEGVSCSSTSGRVTELVLPDKGLTGYLPSELGFLLTLRRLSLPHNNLSNPIPTRLLSIPALASLDLSHNSLTGPIPGQIRLLSNLTFLDLSSNALSGPLPPALAQLPSLAGTLNLSYNRFSGPIPTAFASFPLSLSLDLRHNNLSGPIPQIGSLLNQGPTAFAGNPYLCGFPLQAPACSHHEGTSTPGSYYNLSRAPTPATTGGHPNPSSTENSTTTGTTFPKITILAGGMALILAAAALVLVVLLVGRRRRRKRRRRAVPAAAPHAVGGGEKQQKAAAMVLGTVSTKMVVDDDDQKGRISEAAEEEDEEEEEEVVDADYHYSASSSCILDKNITRKQNNNSNDGGELRVLDEGFAVGLEELLRASAYVVGKSRSGIVYKVVVGKGVAVAVRRLSELGGGGGTHHLHVQGRRSDHHHDELEAEVEAIGRVRHPNLVRLRAYYFAPDERLLVSDYIPNGTLHSALHAEALTAAPLPWTVRLKIAQGAARGIAYIHEFSPGKYVHGSIKSSKLLLGEDHQPYVSGFGLAQLISCARGSTDFVRKRQNSFYRAAPALKSSLPTSTSSSYSAPEARGGGNGHTQKCDVYAFGIVLLEILTGRLPDPSPESNGMDLERFVRQAFKEERPLSDIVDPLLLHEVYAKKQVLATFHIALGCTESNPEARPRMKAVSECLERIEFL